MSWRDRCRPYIAAPELKDRGWTETMIKALLGTPDDTAPNPGGRNAPRMRLWLFTRVEQVEASDGFRRRLALADARRAASARRDEGSTSG
ncbi:hypothetical protein [Qaidamihabitans albus]|uniref:hypothetical protein n=1 Tax=Qaidamihabitans albus TaxID=2795733 RepID=UPI0018F249CB|nr:hypothetical protein [Qaidamihabitans albus]